MATDPPRAHPEDTEAVPPVLVTLLSYCDRATRALLRAGHPYLTSQVLRQRARRSPQRQRFELEQLLQGQRPFTVKNEVFDTVAFSEISSCLASSGGLVNQALQFVARLRARAGLPAAPVPALGATARAILADCTRLWQLIRGAWVRCQAGQDGPAYRRSPPRDWTGAPEAWVTLARVQGGHTCAGLLTKCVRDLRRSAELAAGRADPSSYLPLVAGGPHARSDVNALVAVWLAERYLLGTASTVEFVSRDHDWFRGPLPQWGAAGGGLHDPRLGLDDHQPPSREDRHAACAASLVWEQLLACGQHRSEVSRSTAAVLGAVVRVAAA